MNSQQQWGPPGDQERVIGTARIYPGTPDADRSVPRKAAAYVRAIEGVAAGRGLCALEADRGRGHPAAALKCLLKQDSQIAQGRRTRMGETLRSVHLSQKPVGPTCEMIRDDIAGSQATRIYFLTHHRRTARGASPGFPTGGQRHEVSPSTADEGCER